MTLCLKVCNDYYLGRSVPTIGTVNQNGSLVILHFIHDSHSSSKNTFDMFKPHCRLYSR